VTIEEAKSTPTRTEAGSGAPAMPTLRVSARFQPGAAVRRCSCGATLSHNAAKGLCRSCALRSVWKSSEFRTAILESRAAAALVARPRTRGGVTDRAVLAVFKPEVALYSVEVARELGCPVSYAAHRLRSLERAGKLTSTLPSPTSGQGRRTYQRVST
jgi:hypothetical protein